MSKKIFLYLLFFTEKFIEMNVDVVPSADNVP